MYRKSFSIMVLIVLVLTIFLTGCGEDEEEIASLSLSIGVSPAMSPGSYSVRVTVTGTGMTPVIKTQTLSSQSISIGEHKMTIINIPAGSNRNVKVEILRDNEITFESSDTIDLVGGITNNLSTQVSPVDHELIADYETTILNTTNLENGFVKIDASQSYDTHYDIEISWDWGDGTVTDFDSRFRAEHTYTSPGVYEITITFRDQSDNPIAVTESVIVTTSFISGNSNGQGLIRPGVGIAGVDLGDSLVDLDDLYGEPDMFEYDEDTDTYDFFYADIGLLGFFWNDFTVAMLTILEPNTSETAGGNGLGSSRTSVESEFGRAEEIDGLVYWYWAIGIAFGYDNSSRVEDISVFEPFLEAPARQTSTSQRGQKIRNSSLFKERHRTTRRMLIQN